MPETAAKPLTYTLTREGETTVVTCQGRLVAGTTDAFYRDLKEVASASKLITLDLGELTYVDSTGLGALTRLYVHARGAGCEFKLLHLGRQLRNLLKLTNLMATFGVAEEHGITVA